ncbi:alpha/beta hydrolase fold domain-containing protein [Nocardia sp. alder85J]|uniref:alpha/beta hydrolase fold domain-containing protein n=1 Tax=Nocardia sp. alder85J TaxID=2862949 RepID=UPI001CD24826|nr:alpha/beta hydrolase fold domain-containing protein [Nocardia sp. alder85J]MCX4092947.1 alpha/beta hydrolase fold domain-containing protein [Nocardia sp. alder85J]
MSGNKAPLGTRLLRRAHDRPDATAAEVIAAREQANRIASSRAARIVAGVPDRRARPAVTTLALPGRDLPLRVFRPRHADRLLPLILSFHGGGFFGGTAAQNDWLNSRLAARCPAVVVAVEYRLAPEHPLPAPVDDGYDTLTHLVGAAADWGVDPTAVAVLGESAGGTLAALLALRARTEGPPLCAQVLNYPCVDWSETIADYPSVEPSDDPMLPPSRLLLARRLCVPPTLDPRTVSPLLFDDLGGLPPALIVTGDVDPVADHGRRYAERLRAFGTAADLVCYPRATHAFLSIPGLVPAARPARRDIVAFLRTRLYPAGSAPLVSAPRRGDHG